MTLGDVDADPQSWDERSDYTLARRYMDYEIRGQANQDEVAWLHAHPVQWLRALKAAKQDTRWHMSRARQDLSADPRKPTGDATSQVHARWAEISAEAQRIRIARQTFLNKVDERVAVIRELLPPDPLPDSHINVLVAQLLDIELVLRAGEVEQARRELAFLILKLGEGIDQHEN
jgi:ribosome-binding protein aMBF1 (putative translation factor)